MAGRGFAEDDGHALTACVKPLPCRERSATVWFGSRIEVLNP